MGKTALAGKFHGIVTSHEVGFPKEDLRFRTEAYGCTPCFSTCGSCSRLS